MKANKRVVGSTGEMSNQIFEDLTEIYRVAAKLKL
jgi:hypothetical protein